ncbi:MAG: nucleotidyltransferase domain-containing protein [Rickettsiales bacterium]|jgi:predicted nucleotidyltransferase|nr:nucleotidyltransferase domain-containing protein [Rickettsiales bacterium]
MKPTEKLKAKKEQILQMINKYEKKGIYNVQIFGSVALNKDKEQSDLDLVFNIAVDKFNYNDYVFFNQELESLLELKVDLFPRIELKNYILEDLDKYSILFKDFIVSL